MRAALALALALGGSNSFAAAPLPCDVPPASFSGSKASCIGANDRMMCIIFSDRGQPIRAFIVNKSSTPFGMEYFEVSLICRPTLVP